MGFLTEKIADVRLELERSPIDESALMARVSMLPDSRDFEGALRNHVGSDVSLIAEVKRSSPSAGAIAETDPAERARQYEEAGASAVSVLTDARHFGGSLSDLEAVHMSASLPVLRKDFIIHPAQLIQARALGADAALLITACLSVSELDAMQAIAGDLGLAALVEVHSQQELETALEAGSKIIGVNARDLQTLEVDVENAFEMLGKIPADRTAVMESGITSRDQVIRARDAGAAAVLVGEALMRAEDPQAKVRELLGVAA